MAGGVHSGMFGVINGISNIRNWQVNDNGASAPFVNSATKAGHGRKQGIASWNGNYLGHGGQPATLPGSYFGFTGYTAPDNDTGFTTGETLTGNAFASNVTINWDWAGGNVLEHQVAFEGHLGLTKSDAAGTADAGISDPEPITPCIITYKSADGTGAETTLGNLTQASLQLNNGIQSYVNSSTGGLTGRKKGIFDWSASISVQDSLLGAGLVKGTAYIFKFYTTASNFWLLKWGYVKEFTGLQVNEETGAIIGHTIMIEMAGVENISGTPTAGLVTCPDGSTNVWP